MRSDHFVLVVVLSLGLIAWSLYHNYQMTARSQIDSKLEKTRQLLQMFVDRDRERDRAPPPSPVTEESEFRQIQMDPFAPPIRRMPINIRTRGDYDDYQVVGYAHKYNKKDMMFQLFGRRIDSLRYEYYVIHPYNAIKIPVRSHNDRELSTGETIHIPGFRGDFQVTIYDINEPRYIPFV